MKKVLLILCVLIMTVCAGAYADTRNEERLIALNFLNQHLPAKYENNFTLKWVDMGKGEYYNGVELSDYIILVVTSQNDEINRIFSREERARQYEKVKKLIMPIAYSSIDMAVDNFEGALICIYCDKDIYFEDCIYRFKFEFSDLMKNR